MIEPTDLVWSTYPDRGLGGQHVGVQTGVQLIHTPTGIGAFVTTNRSQFLNKKVALEMIETALTHPEIKW